MTVDSCISMVCYSSLITKRWKVDMKKIFEYIKVKLASPRKYIDF